MPDFQTGRLNPRERDAFQAHLSGCPACRKQLAWEEALDRSLRAEPAIKAPRGFNQAVWQKIKVQAAEPAVRPERPAFRFMPTGLTSLAVTAAAVVLILVSSRSIHFLNPPAPAKFSAQAPARPLPVPALRSAQPAQQARRAVRPLMPVPLDHEMLPPVAQRAQAQAQPAVAAAPQTGAAQSQNLRPRQAAQAPVNGPGLSHSIQAGPGQSLPDARVKPAEAGSANVLSGGTPRTLSDEPRLFNNKIRSNWGERARLEFNQSSAGPVRAKIYSRDGRLVKTLLDTQLAVGPQTVEWDGTTDSGPKAASGIYFLVLHNGSEEKKFKIAVIK
jgi:hypothetical protein